MSTETCNIVRQGTCWAVNHNGAVEGDYATKEAAFEAATAAASNAIKIGAGVAITAEARAPGESAMGGRP